jgi:prolyl oligopeptidase
MPSLPVTQKRPVHDQYHGVQVQDDYRWLEDTTDPEVQAWMHAQNERTRAVLDTNPALPKLRERLRETLHNSH